MGLSKELRDEIKEGLSPKKDHMIEVLRRMWFTIEEFEHLNLEGIDIRELPSLPTKGNLPIPFRFYNFDQLVAAESLENSRIAYQRPDVDLVRAAQSETLGDDSMLVDGSLDAEDVLNGHQHTRSAPPTDGDVNDDLASMEHEQVTLDSPAMLNLHTDKKGEDADSEGGASWETDETTATSQTSGRRVVEHR